MLLLVAFLMGAPLLWAQTETPTKKVAILEVVDRDNAINYGVKLLLRTTLAKAITQTKGYEGYDRVDMGAIQGEQDFQRTGMVSDEQIRRLGEMTGAAYVLVAEAQANWVRPTPGFIWAIGIRIIRKRWSGEESACPAWRQEAEWWFPGYL